MKLIRQSYKLIGTPTTLEEAWKLAEKAYRNCYQSLPKDPTLSSEKWCRNFIRHNANPDIDHMSPLEFGAVYLMGDLRKDAELKYLLERYRSNPYSRVYYDVYYDTFYITTNLRVILENKWEDDFKYATFPHKNHILFVAFQAHCALQVYKDCRTHRTTSWAVESTRFCNYAKDKFGNELTFALLPDIANEYPVLNANCNKSLNEEFIKGLYYDISESGVTKYSELAVYLGGMYDAEQRYLQLINDYHWTPQMAAKRLPQDTAAHVIFGGYEDSLNHMFMLRAAELSGPVDPMVKEIMYPAWQDYKDFVFDKQEKVIDNIIN